MKGIRGWIFFFLGVLLSPLACPAQVSGELRLRDAIYLYNQDIDAKSSAKLWGIDCDVFQLVLDVTSGFADITEIAHGNSSVELSANKSAYPDRIYSQADMFAYALDQGSSFKSFSFGEKANVSSSALVGTATIFGYCYSTKSSAKIAYSKPASVPGTCTFRYSNGTTGAPVSCMPTTTEKNQLSDLYGQVRLSFRERGHTVSNNYSAYFSSKSTHYDTGSMTMVFGDMLETSSQQTIGCAKLPTSKYVNGTRYTYSCVVDNLLSVKIPFLFNINSYNAIYGIATFCDWHLSSDACATEILTRPSGVVTGSVTPLSDEARVMKSELESGIDGGHARAPTHLSGDVGLISYILELIDRKYLLQ